MISQETIKKIYDDAVKAAETPIGSTFLGAFGEAEKCGYKRGTLEYRLFSTIYLDAIPSEIVTNWDGVVVKTGANKSMSEVGK